MYTRTRAFVRAYVHTYTCVCVCVCVCVCLCSCIQMLETALPNYKWLQDEIGQAAFLLQIGFSLAHIAMKAGAAT